MRLASMLLLTLSISLSYATHATAEHVAGARAAQQVYERLLAPCCWTQTLDVHESEQVTQLRAEITARLLRGESGAEIEDDLARRYGERIRAVPRGRDPRESAARWIMLGIGLALLGMCVTGWRWTRRARSAGSHDQAAPAATDLHTDYDARIDRELARAER